MQAIETRYIGPTNFRGSRVKASAQAGSITIGWDDALNVDENHDAAAVALVRKLGWEPATLASGGLPSGKGNCYALIGKRIDVGVTGTVRVGKS